MRKPKLIPIYDATAPIACTITNAEIPERVELIERMRARVASVDRTATGMLLHFPDDPTIRDDLATFAVDEKRCCQFWGFAVVDEDDGVALRWDGPPAADDIVDRLETYFRTNAPISTLDGLL